MHVTEITVSAGRVVNHPYEQYSNLRPNITIKAQLEEGEDFEAATRTLQAKAERLVEDHKNALLENLKEIHFLTQRQKELASLEDGLKRTQSRIDQIRADMPEQTAIEGIGMLPTPVSTDDEEEDYREPRW